MKERVTEERGERGGSCNLHTLIKLLFRSLALHVRAPSAPPTRPHIRSLCLSAVTSVLFPKRSWNFKKTEGLQLPSPRSQRPTHTHTQCPPSCSVSASLLSFSSSCSPVLSFLYNFPSHLPPYLFVHSFIHFILFSVSRLHLQSVSLLPVEPVYLGSPFLSSYHLLSYLFFSLKPNFFLILLPKCSLCRICSI